MFFAAFRLSLCPLRVTVYGIMSVSEAARLDLDQGSNLFISYQNTTYAYKVYIEFFVFIKIVCLLVEDINKGMEDEVALLLPYQEDIRWIITGKARLKR